MSVNRVAIITMGCRVNGFDSAVLADQLKKNSFEVLDEHEEADAYIINSCSVTASADAEVEQLVRRTRKENEPLVIVTGCFAQVQHDALSQMKGVHFVVGNDRKGEVIEILRAQREAPSLPSSAVIQVGRFSRKEGGLIEPLLDSIPRRRRAYLKIQDGCEEYCSFCIIPFSRGPSRSRSQADVVNQVRRFVKNGYQEVVLTGIHIANWGADLEGRPSFRDVLSSILNETDVPRLRISSIEPMQLSDDLLDFWIANKRICSFLHLSIQSGSERILKRMRRRYTPEHCSRIVRRFQTGRKDAFVGFDIIAGFPGESAEDFETTFEFLQELPWAKLHAFPFSPRPLTAAARYAERVEEGAVKERMKRLLLFSELRFAKFQEAQIGRTGYAIPIRDANKQFKKGICDNSLTIHFKDEIPPGVAQVKIEISELTNGHLFGKVIDIIPYSGYFSP